MAVSIAKLAIQFVADTSGMVAGTTKAQAALGKFVGLAKGVGVSLAGMGLATATAAVGMFVREIRQSFDEIDALAKQSKKMGIGVEELQGFAYAAELSGVSAGQLTKSVVRMLDTIGEASMGNKAAAASFKALGLSVDNLKGKSPREAFVEIADAIAKVPNPALRTKMAMDILGKSAADLMPLLLEGREGIEKLFAERGEMFGLTAEDAAAIERANDAWSRMAQHIKSAADYAAVELAPAVEAAAVSTSEMFAEFAKWAKGQDGTIATREEQFKKDAAAMGVTKDNPLGANADVGTILALGGRALAIENEKKFREQERKLFGGPIDRAAENAKRGVTDADLAAIRDRNAAKTADDFAKSLDGQHAKGIYAPFEIDSMNETLGKAFGNLAAGVQSGAAAIDGAQKKAADAIRPLLGGDGVFAEEGLASVLTEGVRGLAADGVEALQGAFDSPAMAEKMLSTTPDFGGAGALQGGTSAAFSQARQNFADQQKAEEMKLQKDTAKATQETAVATKEIAKKLDFQLASF